MCFLLYSAMTDEREREAAEVFREDAQRIEEMGEG